MMSPKPPKNADPKMYFFLFLLTLGSTLGYQGWTLLYTNFAVESAGLSAAQNGIVQSLREVPGFLGFTVIPLLLILKEHKIAALAVIANGLGTALTGFFPSYIPVICTTFLMSVGLHYFEAVNQSLLLQYFDLRTTPLVMSRLRGLAAGGSLAASVLVFLFAGMLPYTWLFLTLGGASIALGVWGLCLDPSNAALPVQNKKMILRSRYWLFYALTLLLGARRQIFIVFALFLLVEKFQMSLHAISLLFMFNYGLNWFFNPLIGRAINAIGERKLLSIEYVTVIIVFIGYGTTDSPIIACILYVIDYAVFNFSIALRTFFQKIGDPQDIAPTMAVGQTMNHVAAIFIPAFGGWLWVEWGYQYPFYLGAVVTVCTLLLVQLIDREISKADARRRS